MIDKIEKVYCNKCGAINKIVFDENNKVIEGDVCINCHNKIDVEVSKFKLNKKSDERLMYELENAVYNDEKNGLLLQECENNGIQNDLTKYLTQKIRKNYDFSFISSDTKDFNLIIKDILRSNWYNDEERIQIINSLNIQDKDLYLNMINETIYKSEKSIQMVDELYKEKIEIVKGMPKEPFNINYLTLFIGIISILVIFLFGLFLKADLGEPLVIILSIIPALLIGVSAIKLTKLKKISKILLGIALVLVLFIVISYIEVIRFDGFTPITTHISNILSSVHNFVEAIFARLEYVEEEIPEETYETGIRIR